MPRTLSHVHYGINLVVSTILEILRVVCPALQHVLHYDCSSLAGSTASNNQATGLLVDHEVLHFSVLWSISGRSA